MPIELHDSNARFSRRRYALVDEAMGPLGLLGARLRLLRVDVGDVIYDGARLDRMKALLAKAEELTQSLCNELLEIYRV